ncbi:unnamed protein product [Caenorhabditis bovis]|uniref:F-box domain-containing protein n=1 Tax=Caenorhabditis bovis TaxID=2654633 RepID=A0A8S1ECD5_9PELO|nr:unnamed protein product [Caenorhabditis bovis]
MSSSLSAAADPAVEQQSSSSSSPPPICHLMSLPEELLSHVDSHLSVEDSFNFKLSNARIDNALSHNFHYYDQMHLSDEPEDCRIVDTRGRAPTRSFKADNAPIMLRMLPNLKDVTVIIKDVNMRGRHPQFPARTISDCTPYTPGGYLMLLLGEMPPEQMALRQLSLHIDIMVETLEDVFLQCPTEDLKYAMEKLSNARFNSFVQISICCAQIRPTDQNARNYLLQGMQYALKQSEDFGAKTEFVVEPCEGYVDMTVEKGNVEYTFAFFYYNPTICDPTPEEAPPTIPLITNYYI